MCERNERERERREVEREIDRGEESIHILNGTYLVRLFLLLCNHSVAIRETVPNMFIAITAYTHGYSVVIRTCTPGYDVVIRTCNIIMVILCRMKINLSTTVNLVKEATHAVSG